MKRLINMRQMSENQKGIIKKISAKGEMGKRIIQIQGRAPQTFFDIIKSFKNYRKAYKEYLMASDRIPRPG